MKRSFIIPILKLLDKCSEEYEGRRDQQPARAIDPHGRLKGYYKKLNSNK